MGERHLERTQELHAAHRDVLDNPEALALVCAAIKEEDREEERERDAQVGRRKAAHEEREGGSSSSARADAQEPETLHGAQEGADTVQGVEEGEEGGLEEELLQVAILASLRRGDEA